MASHTYYAMIGHHVRSEPVIQEGETFGQLLKQEARLPPDKRNKLETSMLSVDAPGWTRMT